MFTTVDSMRTPEKKYFLIETMFRLMIIDVLQPADGSRSVVNNNNVIIQVLNVPEVLMLESVLCLFILHVFALVLQHCVNVV